MGVYADLRAQPSVEAGSLLDNELRNLEAGVDPDRPAAFDSANEVQTVAQYLSDPSAGTFTLAITIDGNRIVTAGIAFDAIASAIEGAIDTAATGEIPGWTNGDITVAGGTLEVAGAPVTLTFDGASVAGSSHVLTEFDPTLLTGGTFDDPPVSRTTTGQPTRYAWAVLNAQSLIDTPLPSNIAARSDIVITTGPNFGNVLLRADVLNEMFRACADEDGNNATYFGLSDAFWIGANTAPNVDSYGNITDLQ